MVLELMDRRLAAETVARATSSRATQTRQRQCALLTMLSSIYGAEQCTSEPLCALAVLTGRHRKN